MPPSKQRIKAVTDGLISRPCDVYAARSDIDIIVNIQC